MKSKNFQRELPQKKPKQRDTTSQVIEKHKSGPIFDIQPLPTGWERKINGAGRIFYVDHINKKTQWEHPLTKPTGIENSTNNNGTIKEEVNSETKLETKQKNNDTIKEKVNNETKQENNETKQENNGTKQENIEIQPKIEKINPTKKEESSSTEKESSNLDDIDELKKIVLSSSLNFLAKLQNLHELPTENDLCRLLGDSVSQSSEESDSGEENSDKSSSKEKSKESEIEKEKTYPYFLPSESSEEVYEYDFGTIRLSQGDKNNNNNNNNDDDDLVEVTDSEDDEFIDSHVYGEPEKIDETTWG